MARRQTGLGGFHESQHLGELFLLAPAAPAGGARCWHQDPTVVAATRACVNETATSRRADEQVSLRHPPSMSKYRLFRFEDEAYV